MTTNNKDLKKLTNSWYKKLKAEGFEDIEYKGIFLNKSTMKNIAVVYNQDTFFAKQEYYRLAGHFLHEHGFKKHRDKLIWEFHAQGISTPEISKELRTQGFRASKTTVKDTILSLVKEMRKLYGL